MAGSSRYTALLDANVLYPTLLRDILLSLATADLFHARWSHDIQAEWSSKLIAANPQNEAKLRHLVDVMNAAIPDCIVNGYQSLVESISLPDKKDRHVVAAAIVGHADAIVTFNLSDFPVAALKEFHIEIQHPDQFVANQLDLHKIRALGALKRMRARWTSPARTAEDLIAALDKRGLPISADMLREAAQLI